jgi:hypothetical protein
MWPRYFPINDTKSVYCSACSPVIIIKNLITWAKYHVHCEKTSHKIYKVDNNLISVDFL